MHFLCFRGSREKSKEFQLTKLQENLHAHDFDAYYISVCVKFDYFFLTEKAYL